MKTYLFIIFAFYFSATTSDCWARSPTSRHAEGVIENVDQDNHTISIQLDSETVNFHWNERTKFFKSDDETDSSMLKVGLKIDYWYRKPLFGDPSVTKVVWKQNIERAFDSQKRVLETGETKINTHMIQHGHSGHLAPVMYSSKLNGDRIATLKVFYHDHSYSTYDGGKCG